MGYGDLLRDIRWQKRRLHMLEKRGWCCEYCCSVTETINVHHRKYRPGLMPWEYEDEELQVLCEPCHTEQHFPGRVLEQLYALIKTAHDSQAWDEMRRLADRAMVFVKRGFLYRGLL